ncbi:PAS domain S-box protein [Aliarcobacter thereius]|uniref:Aerotaxis receptor n=2 Tax=Aliarcobacter thereius TaxID=544718 RepID=A0A1C0B7Z2_9BACT|nr:PAS domain S-box protein [Aliarcobacter thereius]OCL95388.1 Aerotaxis receptor [Aliarcobacter thereius LMG 24486]OCL99719.1 Aerotaxis receptor [Aliarcobacter thereius]QBF16624.1 PAS sensor-containing signal transduction protein [Aliarcobacter thereius LMG 24486]TLS73088.1 PAS domain S-box protein [Aliarcobacter thereius]TLS93652.1 PAS domain S-box protein [Aliarcobacter thereius]
MNKIKYLILFFLALITFIFFFTYLKNSDFEKVNNKTKEKALKEYKTIEKEFADTAEFIYFTELVKSEELLNLLVSEKNPIRLKNRLYDEFESNYSYYSSLGVFDISFYTKDGALILNFQDINFKDSFTNSLLDSVTSSKKEQYAYKIISNEGYLVFSKPIFDKDLNFIAIINIEFDLDTLLEKLETNMQGFEFLKLFSSKLNRNNLDSFIKNESDLEKIEKIINNKLDTTYVLNEDGVKKTLTFMKITDMKFYDDTFYIVFFNKNDIKIEKIDSFYSYIFVIFTIFLVVLIFITIYLLQLKTKNSVLKNDLKDILNQIDKYISKVDFDLDGKITYVSKSFCKISGYSEDEILGKDIEVLKHNDVSENFYKSLKKELKNVKNWQGEIKNRDKFGNTYWVKINIFPKYNSNNSLIGYSSIRSDITDKKQLEKINKLLKDDLSNRLSELRLLDRDLKDESKLSLVSKILDSISHQWKQPISKISYEMKRVRNIEDMDQKTFEKLQDNVSEELQNLSFILNDVKKLFKSSKHNISNLSLVFDNIKTTLESKLKNSKNCKLVLETEDETEIKIAFFELKSILKNIILFILEQVEMYSDKKCTITIELIENNEEQIIKIHENIESAEKKEFLDEIISKLDNTYLDSKLYLAKLLIEKNGAIFLCKNSINETSYYIKVKK